MSYSEASRENRRTAQGSEKSLQSNKGPDNDSICQDTRISPHPPSRVSPKWAHINLIYSLKTPARSQIMISLFFFPDLWSLEMGKTEKELRASRWALFQGCSYDTNSQDAWLLSPLRRGLSQGSRAGLDPATTTIHGFLGSFFFFLKHDLLASFRYLFMDTPLTH